MKQIIKKEGLPDVVFHSLRHTSVTYKLKLSGSSADESGEVDELERPSRNGASFSKELLQKRLYKRNQALNANSPFVITDEILEHHYLIKKSRILSLSEP